MTSPIAQGRGVEPPPPNPFAWRELVPVWRWTFPLACGFAVVTALRDHAATLPDPAHASFWYWASGEVLVFAFWALAAPFILGLVRALPLTRGRRLLGVGVHGAVYLGLAAIYTVYYRYVDSILDPPRPAMTLGNTFYVAVSGGILKYYLPILVGGWIVAHRNRLQQQELRNVHLKAALAREQLRALKMQLQPHFLFNTLHSISALIESDPPAADQMVMKLGQLLRMSLDEAAHDFVPLGRELDYIRTYLEIEETRFSDRLSVLWDIDPRTIDVQVPVFLLQPAVENAIKHGIARSSAGGRIFLRTRLDEGRLGIWVENEGPALRREPSPEGPGLGLKNLRERLTYAYRQDFDLQVASRSQSPGVVVSFSLPSRPDFRAPKSEPRIAALEVSAP
jgi:two-component system LytT family sensor kinase